MNPKTQNFFKNNFFKEFMEFKGNMNKHMTDLQQNNNKCQSYIQENTNPMLSEMTMIIQDLKIEFNKEKH